MGNIRTNASPKVESWAEEFNKKKYGWQTYSQNIGTGLSVRVNVAPPLS